MRLALQGRMSSSRLGAASSIGKSPQGLDCKVFLALWASCRTRRGTTGQQFSSVGRVPVLQQLLIGCLHGSSNRTTCPEKTCKLKSPSFHHHNINHHLHKYPEPGLKDEGWKNNTGQVHSWSYLHHYHCQDFQMFFDEDKTCFMRNQITDLFSSANSSVWSPVVPKTSGAS